MANRSESVLTSNIKIKGNITEKEFKKIVEKMPSCSYKTNVAMSYFWD